MMKHDAIRLREELRKAGFRAGTTDDSDESVGLYNNWTVWLDVDGEVFALEECGGIEDFSAVEIFQQEK